MSNAATRSRQVPHSLARRVVQLVASGQEGVRQMFPCLRWNLLIGGEQRRCSMHGWVRGVPKPMNATIWGYDMSKKQILFQMVRRRCRRDLHLHCPRYFWAVAQHVGHGHHDRRLLAPRYVICLRGAICRLRVYMEASAVRENPTRWQMAWRLLFAVPAASILLAVAISGFLSRLPAVLLLAVGLANPVIIELIQSARDICNAKDGPAGTHAGED